MESNPNLNVDAYESRKEFYFDLIPFWFWIRSIYGKILELK
jgi:hypothetical protein